METYALLDEGSTVTLLDKAVAERLGLSGSRKPLSLQWTNNMSNYFQDSQQVSLKLQRAVRRLCYTELEQ